MIMAKKTRAPSRNQPVDKALYEKAKRTVKARVQVWPSAYASGQVVQEYKRLGGRYRSLGGSAAKKGRTGRTGSQGKRDANAGLTRWFAERWVNVCETTSAGKYKKCGRKKATSSAKKYPYCRPSVRVSAQTPKTVGEMSSAELKRMCAKKRSTPQARGGKPTRNPTARRSQSKAKRRPPVKRRSAKKK